MKTYNGGGQKDLTGKLPVHLVTMNMMDGIAEGLLCGILKGYEKHNWKKGLPICEAHLGAALRHIYKYMGGEDFNVEFSKENEEILTHHLDNALSHLAMAVHQIKEGRDDLDDRELVGSEEEYCIGYEEEEDEDEDFWGTASIEDLETGMEQARQGMGRPLSFDLDDQDGLEFCIEDTDAGYLDKEDGEEENIVYETLKRERDARMKKRTHDWGFDIEGPVGTGTYNEDLKNL